MTLPSSASSSIQRVLFLFSFRFTRWKSSTVLLFLRFCSLAESSGAAPRDSQQLEMVLQCYTGILCSQPVWQNQSNFSPQLGLWVLVECQRLPVTLPHCCPQRGIELWPFFECEWWSETHTQPTVLCRLPSGEPLLYVWKLGSRFSGSPQLVVEEEKRDLGPSQIFHMQKDNPLILSVGSPFQIPLRNTG